MYKNDLIKISKIDVIISHTSPVKLKMQEQIFNASLNSVIQPYLC